MKRIANRCLFVFAACVLLNPVPSLAKSIPVVSTTELNTGDWFPLPEHDLKAAATDTALSELSKGGVFEIVSSGRANDTLNLKLSLIGSAEMAKLTITVNIKNQPTYVSTSSISLRNIGYKGIYDALEHIGETAAKRMNDKIEALVIRPGSPNPEPSVAANNKIEKKLRKQYNQAQQLKRSYQYKEARILLEQIAASAGKKSSTGKLAEDELHYGLTIFEAQQTTVGLAMASGNATQINANLTRAEYLYRQILAENSDSLQRTMEAQRALDGLLVTRNAVKAAVNAQMMVTAKSVEMMIEHEYMMMGDCPSKSRLQRTNHQMDGRVKLLTIKSNNTGKEYKYKAVKGVGEFSIQCGDGNVTTIQ